MGYCDRTSPDEQQRCLVSGKFRPPGDLALSTARASEEPGQVSRHLQYQSSRGSSFAREHFICFFALLIYLSFSELIVRTGSRCTSLASCDSFLHSFKEHITDHKECLIAPSVSQVLICGHDYPVKGRLIAPFDVQVHLFCGQGEAAGRYGPVLHALPRRAEK